MQNCLLEEVLQICIRKYFYKMHIVYFDFEKTLENQKFDNLNKLCDKRGENFRMRHSSLE